MALSRVGVNPPPALAKLAQTADPQEPLAPEGSNAANQKIKSPLKFRLLLPIWLLPAKADKDNGGCLQIPPNGKDAVSNKQNPARG